MVVFQNNLFFIKNKCSLSEHKRIILNKVYIHICTENTHKHRYKTFDLLFSPEPNPRVPHRLHWPQHEPGCFWDFPRWDKRYITATPSALFLFRIILLCIISQNVFLCFCFGYSHNEVHGRSSSQGPIGAVCGLHHPEGKAQPLIHMTSYAHRPPVVFIYSFYFWL